MNTMFSNRAAAGRLLAEKLAPHAGRELGSGREGVYGLMQGLVVSVGFVIVCVNVTDPVASMWAITA